MGMFTFGYWERAESPPLSIRGTQTMGGMEQEKRIRREIANSNERRRMQNINAGFQSLRNLLPHHESEKLSKAAILQQTAEYICQLEQEKTRLLSQNCHLKRLLYEQEGDALSGKKRKTETELGEFESTPGTGANDLIDVRVQLDRERRLRMMLEEQVRTLESQLYLERIREITQKAQIHYQHGEDEDLRNAVITPLRLKQETAAAVASLQVVGALGPVAHTETVISTLSPPTSPHC